MKRLTWAALVAVGLLAALACRQAGAQTPFSRPAFSPYLNLQRGGNPAINYYGLVRPQQEATRAIQQLQVQQQALQGLGQPLGVAGLDPLGPLPTTGHAATFMNYSHYYPLGRPGAFPSALGGLRR